MGWRYIIIDDARRINYKLNNIGILQGEEPIWINLDEIDCIIIEDSKCNITVRLAVELSRKGIIVIFCSENHQPIGILQTLDDNKRTSKYSKTQINWNNVTKRTIWKKIIQHKILLQKQVLLMCNKLEKISLLCDYISHVEDGDATNREGLAAKVYFFQLFGKKFIRERNADDIINSSLNYIYQVVRSKITQEIVGHGYIPCFGIYHCSEYNYFNLADDLIEVFRPLCDYYVIKLIEKEKPEYMYPLYKEKIVSILLEIVYIKNTRQKLCEAIQIYVNSVLNAFEQENIDIISFPDFVYDK